MTIFEFGSEIPTEEEAGNWSLKTEEKFTPLS
jgi:hypothetical protein